VSLSTPPATFIAGGNTNAIFKVSSGAIATPWRGGSGVPPYLGDGGPATSAAFNQATGIAVDSAGTLYIADIAMLYENAAVTNYANYHERKKTGDVPYFNSEKDTIELRQAPRGAWRAM
jgi:hypothetical protein